MKGSRLAVIASSTVLAAAAAIALARSSPSSNEPASRPASFSADAWPAGATAAYHIVWKTDADVILDLGAGAGGADKSRDPKREPAPLGTHLDVDGELTLRSYGSRDGAVALGFVLSRVDVARAEALGNPAAPPDQLGAELRAGEAVVLVEPDGHVRELGFSPSTTPLARDALRALVLEYTAEISAANGRAVVDTSLGRARIEKTASGAPKRAAYDELDALPNGFDARGARNASTGTGTVTGSARAVANVASREEISAFGESGVVARFHAVTSLSATLLRTENEPPAQLPSYAPAPVRVPSTEPSRAQSESDRALSLARRSMGVTRESVYSDVHLAGLLPQRPLTQWIWRDAAFLELHPEETSVLLDRAMKEPAIGIRAAAVDIVVISGTDAAQRALVHTFTTTTMSDDDREVLLQRLGQLHRPSADLLRWIEAEHDRSKNTDLWLATSFTLGALAWRSAELHPAVSERFVVKLEAELLGAKDDAKREIAIRALGNAGAARSAAVLLPYANSSVGEVRAGVASALRRIDGEPVVDTLLQLVTDPDDFVSRDAVESLYRKQLADEDWRFLARAIDENRIAEGTHAVLLDGALLRRQDDPESARLFTAMLASEHVSMKLKQRIASLVMEDAGQ